VDSSSLQHPRVPPHAGVLRMGPSLRPAATGKLARQLL